MVKRKNSVGFLYIENLTVEEIIKYGLGEITIIPALNSPFPKEWS